jgi:hypothetical protein
MQLAAAMTSQTQRLRLHEGCPAPVGSARLDFTASTPLSIGYDMAAPNGSRGTYHCTLRWQRLQ